MKNAEEELVDRVIKQALVIPFLFNPPPPTPIVLFLKKTTLLMKKLSISQKLVGNSTRDDDGHGCDWS